MPDTNVAGTRQTLIYLGCVLMLAASLSANVAMGQRLRRVPLRMANPQFERGESISAIRGSFAGEPVANLSLRADRKTLIHVFSSDCGWSVRGYKDIAAIFQKTHNSYQFIGVTTDAQVNSKNGWPQTVPWPLLRVDMKTTPADVLRKLTSTPQLLLVDHTGMIQERWVGAFFGGEQREVERYFGVHLPGVDPIR